MTLEPLQSACDSSSRFARCSQNPQQETNTKPLNRETGQLRERIAKLEKLLEGLREAVTKNRAA